ncbi:MAG: 1,4-alpha-glucan branching protein GlgB [bacterium]
METSSQTLTHEHHRLINGQHHDPFALLGHHSVGDNLIQITVFAPHIQSIVMTDNGQELRRVEGTDLFTAICPEPGLSPHPCLEAVTKSGHQYSFIDPYTFSPQIPDFDLELFQAGKHLHVYHFLGANPRVVDGIPGILFSTWAPNAQRVSVVGDFNEWDGRRHPLRSRGGSGVWEVFIPELPAGIAYKFEILAAGSGQVLEKTDPYGKFFQKRPETAAVIAPAPQHQWQDQAWLEARQHRDWMHSPMSIYEVHLGSWQRSNEGEFLNYRELAHRLVKYLIPLNYTHVELLPITEHPLDDSWGYQVTGYYAPTSRFGTPDDFRYFMDYLHQHGLGVILDWVPAHFPKDAWALAEFDGQALYEHADARKGEHRDWGTKIFNLSRNEVRNFLLANVLYWIEEFHIDGIRMDAVASMLYLDYSREPHDWIPNEHGGNENYEAIHFIKELNYLVGSRHPGVVTIAEESTAWPMVSRPTDMGGLGFSMKWNMGWMHDTLKYMSSDPVYRKHEHDKLTFGLLYSFTENFVLPFSHDEVVHGKASMVRKMPGDYWQQFANLRLLYTYQATYPGKKLLFMGSEFGQFEEWDNNASLLWSHLDHDAHRGLSRLVGDLNRLYKEKPALHELDFAPEGFQWLDCNDGEQSVISYVRRGKTGLCIVVLNFTPVPRHDYRIPVPQGGKYREQFNSDSVYYHGSNIGNGPELNSEAYPWAGHEHSLTLNLPPLSGLILEPCDD